MAFGMSGLVYAIPCSVGEYVYGDPDPLTYYKCELGSGNDWHTINDGVGFFGFTDWAQLEKNDGGVEVEDFAVGLGITGLNATAGTWSFSNTPWGSYSDILLVLKRGNGFSAHNVLPVDTSGHWNTGGDPDLSHMSVFGRGTPIPEPSTMLLLGIGIAGFVGFRRKLKS